MGGLFGGGGKKKSTTTTTPGTTATADTDTTGTTGTTGTTTPASIATGIPSHDVGRRRPALVVAPAIFDEGYGLGGTSNGTGGGGTDRQTFG